MTWIKIELHYFVKGKYSEMKYNFFPDKHFLVYFIQFRKKPNLIISEIVDEMEFAYFFAPLG